MNIDSICESSYLHALEECKSYFYLNESSYEKEVIKIYFKRIPSREYDNEWASTIIEKWKTKLKIDAFELYERNELREEEESRIYQEERRRAEEEEERRKAEAEMKRNAQNEANKKKLEEMQTAWRNRQQTPIQSSTPSASTATLQSCPKCGVHVSASSKFCTACGAKLIAKCSKCGVTLKPSAKFCTQCGTAVN